MFRCLFLAALLALAACQKSNKSSGQVLTSPSAHDAKTAPIPPPEPVEIPGESSPVPQPSPATLAGTSQSYVDVDRAVIDVPRGGEQVVDIPFSQIPLPKGEISEEAVDYNIPQPVIEVPGPAIQSKPVVFNVPQQVIQVPSPVIRPRPIIYRVPYSLRVQKPVVKHQEIFYRVPSASFVPKSALVQDYVPETPIFQARVL